MPTITVVGSLNMDIAVRALRFPAPGETIRGGDLRMIPGGKGANQAVAIARQGLQVSMVGRLGDDIFGGRLLASLQSEGVDTTHLLTTQGTATGVAIITINEEGENTIVLASGANLLLNADDIEAIKAPLQRSDALVMQLEIPIEAVMRAAHLAREQRKPIILNAAPARELAPELLAMVDYLIVNEVEAASLTNGGSVGNPGNTRDAATALLARGVRNVIITLGKEGALYAGRGFMEMVAGFPVPVVDTTAAGDAFVGAFASALTSGKSLHDAVRWGNAAGALAVTAMGAQPSLPSYESVVSFLKEQDATLE